MIYAQIYTRSSREGGCFNDYEFGSISILLAIKSMKKMRLLANVLFYMST
jgi:hypothetical protein